MTDNSAKISAQHPPLRPVSTVRAGISLGMRKGDRRGFFLVAVIFLFIFAIIILQQFQIPSHASASSLAPGPKEGLKLGDDYIYRLSSEPTPYMPPKPLKRLDDELVLGRDQAQTPPCLTAPLRWEH